MPKTGYQSDASIFHSEACMRPQLLPLPLPRFDKWRGRMPDCLQRSDRPFAADGVAGAVNRASARGWRTPLENGLLGLAEGAVASELVSAVVSLILREYAGNVAALDRKSTRLNSSHPSISYAVFCLKKKKKQRKK